MWIPERWNDNLFLPSGTHVVLYLARFSQFFHHSKDIVIISAHMHILFTFAMHAYDNFTYSTAISPSSHRESEILQFGLNISRAAL